MALEVVFSVTLQSIVLNLKRISKVTDWEDRRTGRQGQPNFSAGEGEEDTQPHQKNLTIFDCQSKGANPNNLNPDRFGIHSHFIFNWNETSAQKYRKICL